MPLLEATLRGLDWPFVVEAWARCARTPMGADAVRRLGPLDSRDQVLEALDATDEILAVEEEGADIPVGGVSDVRAAARRAEKGLVLEPNELLAAGRSLRALLDLAHVLDRLAEPAPTLARWASDIVVDRFVADELETAFDPTGRLSGARYPELEELRKGIQRLHEEVRGTLDRLVRGEELGDDILQDRFWTVRDDRYVVPIKAHAKRWDLGIVHGTSGSGRTVFVEPHTIVQLNNQLRLAEGRLRAAEHAILTELSRELGTQADALDVATEAATRIDVACARAGLARALAATRPAVGEDGVIRVKHARHPVLVLRGVDVVANDLEVTTDHPVLVLSGPNAGGKTVALKTLGLCAELVRHGCHTPTAEGSRVDQFDQVLASIGDQQTVEGDLSSFSAHLVTLKAMLEAAAPGQLLLLDELASGTDPAQGAALAQAVCEDLARNGPRVVVTTHFAALKAMGAADPRFQVAAVQYVDGRPTYRVLMGATGESHALDIASRVGLPPSVLARAEACLGEQQAELGRLLVTLEAQRAEVERLRTEATERARSLSEREEHVRRRATELEAQAAERYLTRLQEAEKAVGQVVAELQRAPTHKAAEAARATIGALRALAPEAEAPPPQGPQEEVQPGERVRVRNVGGVGEIVSVSGSNAQVRIGGLTVRVRVADLDRVASARQGPRGGGTAVSFAPRARQLEEAVRVPGNTLDMRGMRVDEGMAAAEQFFDRAVRSGWDSVFLLHGHGTGALKDGLRGWLRSSGYVADWCPASEEQGGDAFTVVQLA